jgi:hypothetical protein
MCVSTKTKSDELLHTDHIKNSAFVPPTFTKLPDILKKTGVCREADAGRDGENPHFLLPVQRTVKCRKTN